MHVDIKNAYIDARVATVISITIPCDYRYVTLAGIVLLECGVSGRPGMWF